MLTYQFKLYHSDKEKYLDKHLDTACEIYNHCIALHRKYYKLFHKSLSVYRLQLHITKLKKLPRYAHWKTLNSQAIQDIAERIDRSYEHFFDHVKKGRAGKKSPPHFRKRRSYHSFTLKQTGYRLDGNVIYIMGKRFKMHGYRDIEGTIKTVTVKKKPTGKWFVFITTDKIARRDYARTGNAAGIDFGLKDFLVLSDGTKISSPQWLKALLSELRRKSRNFSLKKKGSKNSEKAKLELEILHEKITNQRRDSFFKLANELCKKYDFIAIENLNLDGMKRLWGRKVSDLAYGEFVEILEYVASTCDREVRKIGRYETTTKKCSVCGEHVNLTLKDRNWTCRCCGTTHDRDVNAAVNILNTALGMS